MDHRLLALTIIVYSEALKSIAGGKFALKVFWVGPDDSRMGALFASPFPPARHWVECVGFRPYGFSDVRLIPGDFDAVVFACGFLRHTNSLVTNVRSRI